MRAGRLRSNVGAICCRRPKMQSEQPGNLGPHCPLSTAAPAVTQPISCTLCGYTAVTHTTSCLGPPAVQGIRVCECEYEYSNDKRLV